MNALTKRQNAVRLSGSIIKLALPAIGEMALSTFVGIADTLMVSYLIGYQGLSGIGFANQLNEALIFVFTAFNTGATAMIARYYGEKNPEGMSRVAGQAILINLILGLAITAVSAVFGRSILSGVFEMSADVLAISLEYFYIVLIGQVFMFFSFSSTAILRGAGDTMTPLLVNGVANILNIIGNYVLITGAGPFPEMGVAGAAASTAGVRILSALAFAYIIFAKHKNLRIRLPHIKISRTVLSKLFMISYPGGIEQLMMNGSYLIMSSILSRLDTLSEAAFRICHQIESISYMPAVGLGVATATLVGKALGEKDAAKAAATAWMASLQGVVWGLIICAVYIFAAEPIVRLFTPDYLVVLKAVPAMLFIGINQPVLNFHIILCGGLRGAGDTMTVMIISAVRIWLLFLPAVWVLIRVLDQGIAGCWQAETFSLLLASIALVVRYLGKKWTRINVHVPFNTVDGESA
jgi:putative MATE family efflux protein